MSLVNDVATDTEAKGELTPTVALSRVPEEVWCDGFGFVECALRAFTGGAVERVRGMAWRVARVRLEEEAAADLENLRAAERAGADIGILTLVRLLVSLAQIQ